MRQRKWWLPISLGIPLALLIGLLACYSTVIHQQYVHYHLYLTAALLLASQIDYYALIVVPTLFLFTLSFSLAGYLKGVPRRTIRFILSLMMMVFATIIGYMLRHENDPRSLLTYWQEMNWFLIKRYMPSIVLGAGGGMFLLAVGIWRCKEALYRGGAKLLQSLAVLHPFATRALSLLSLLLIAIFLGVNGVVGYFTVSNGWTLKQKPNVILIMIDTLRADHMGCYGYARNTTPNLDRFARESTLFSKAISQAPWTAWSVFSFMTSHYPDVFEIKPTPGKNDHRFPKLAEVLKEQGYSTNAIISNSVLQWIPEFKQGFDYFDTSPAPYMEQTTSDKVTGVALQRLAQIKENKFFLFLLYVDPHAPYVRHPGFTFDDNTFHGHPVKQSLAPDHSGLRPQRCNLLKQAVADYDSEIAYTDYHIGRVLDRLKQQNLYDDSLIILLADHGEEFQEHGHTGHLYTLYDEVLNVPFIVKLPRQQQGVAVNGTFPLINLFPSVLGVLHANNPAYRTAGQDADFAHLRQYPERPIYSATVQGVFSTRTSQYKYILHAAHNRQELYDLIKDPWEQHNLSTLRGKELTSWYAQLQSRAGQAPDLNALRQNPGGASSMYSKEQLDRLRSIGYLQ